MFHYNQDDLFCEDISLGEIARAVGTPVYIYSQAELQSKARAYRTAVGEGLVCYAVKANGNISLLRLLCAEGVGADVTSGGELFLALKAGIPAEKILFSGVGKRADEIKMALEANIRAIHIESAGELAVVQTLAKSLGRKAPISIRVNPDISADTHPYDSTGELGHKFGVPKETAVSLYRMAQADAYLQPVGIAAHIGSQITSLTPYQKLAHYMAGFAGELRVEGIDLAYIDMGGGLGINYRGNDAPEVKEWITAVSGPVLAGGFQLAVEPGRSIIADAGVLMTRVTNQKSQGGKSFVIVDAGMNDLIRPAMYGAFHSCRPVQRTAGEEALVDIVGPICETGDFLAKDRLLPALSPGDLLAFGQAGAYGFAMSSNYNGRLRAAEVLVNGHEFRVIRRRQGYEHLLDGTEAAG